MPKCAVNDIDIMYEAYGQGETIVYLQSVLGGINPGAYYFAGRLSGQFRVIIWDGPNCGQSGVTIQDAPSEYHMACGYLAGLLDRLGEGTVHLAGCSGGGEMGLLFAHLYPERVRSLAMYRPTDTSSSIERDIIQARYFDLAEAAESSMEAAVSYSENPPAKKFGNLSRWLADLCRKDRDTILGLDHRTFARIMRNWGAWMENPLFYRANLNDGELGRVAVPTLLYPCADRYHPERLAEDLHRHLPHSTYIPTKRLRQDNEIYDAAYDENPFGGFDGFVDAYEQYMERLMNARQ